MLIALILAALLATDIAVAVLYFSTRPGRHTRGAASAGSEAATREIEELVVTLRRQAEQATAEIGRQKAQLRRLLAGMDGNDQHAAAEFAQPLPAAPLNRPPLSDENLAATVAAPRAVAPRIMPSAAAAGATSEQVRRLASEGLPPRAIAGRTRLSVEEVRLMLALSDARKSA
jgi:hypothetical protein